MAKGQKAHLVHIDFSGSKMSLDLHRGVTAELAGINLTIDRARVHLLAASCGLSVSGLGRTNLEVGWDLMGGSPRLTRDGVDTSGPDGLELLPQALLARAPGHEHNPRLPAHMRMQLQRHGALLYT